MDRLAIVHLIAGGSAGLVETCVMTPVDLIKVRFQIQRGLDDPTRYASIFDCARKILKQEGFLSFYKGVLPPILGETPKRAIKFFSFEQYKTTYTSLFPQYNFLVTALSSLCAGVTEGFISHPFDIVKIQLQSERSKFIVAPSASEKAKQLFHPDRQLGVRLRRGLTSVLARNGTFNVIYLTIYQQTKQLIPQDIDKKTNMAYKFAIGTVGGTIGSVCNVPFDVAMSRIQSQPFSTPALNETHIPPQSSHNNNAVSSSSRHIHNHTTCNHSLFNPSTVAILRKCFASRQLPAQQSHDSSFHLLSNALHTKASPSNHSGDAPKYRTCIGTIATVYKEEGFLALYKGLLPKIIRLGPGGGLMIIVYEYVNQKLQFMV